MIVSKTHRLKTKSCRMTRTSTFTYRRARARPLTFTSARRRCLLQECRSSGSTEPGDPTAKRRSGGAAATGRLQPRTSAQASAPPSPFHHPFAASSGANVGPLFFFLMNFFSFFFLNYLFALPSELLPYPRGALSRDSERVCRLRSRSGCSRRRGAESSGGAVRE